MYISNVLTDVTVVNMYGCVIDCPNSVSEHMNVYILI